MYGLTISSYPSVAPFGACDQRSRYWMKHTPGLHVRYESAHTFDYDGRKMPVVWAEGPLNPGQFAGKRPHAMWGHLWQFLSTRVPEWYELTVRREARWRKRLGATEFRGWDFICPGRCDEHGKHVECGRRSRRLFMPMPAQTINMFLNDAEGFEVEELGESNNPLHLSGRWHPETNRVWEAAEAEGLGGLCFACDHCWRPRYLRVSQPKNAWNAFVTTLSGGLIYGKEVPMPTGLIRAEEARPRQRRRAVAASAAERSAVPMRRTAGGCN